ncbi:MAG: UvrD-helicase domain-containing protein [Comamonadaceae bacterium]|nr:UvrD-helicase domain-containing protein [Comamonadaceae bacterium]
MTQLNPRQNEAVRYIDGPLLVLAGAGSGKTRVITAQDRLPDQERGIAPSRIAADHLHQQGGARDARARRPKLLGARARRAACAISTFHTLGADDPARGGCERWAASRASRSSTPPTRRAHGRASSSRRPDRRHAPARRAVADLAPGRTRCIAPAQAPPRRRRRRPRMRRGARLRATTSDALAGLSTRSTSTT